MQNLTHIEKSRVAFSKITPRERKASLGQFLTPYPVAKFMSSLFTNLSNSNLKLLDPGAGLGSLSVSFIENFLAKNPFGELYVDAYEIDKIALRELKINLNKKLNPRIYVRILNSDFIQSCNSKNLLHFERSYTNIILNPPYKKINNSSKEKKTLKTLGFDTVNLYSAFMFLSINKLIDNGELVAIIPRSFCNGVYYKNFRKFLIENTIIKQIHLIESRKSTFSEDDVLQENIIIHLEKKININPEENTIKISHTNSIDFTDLKIQNFAFRDICKPGDNDFIIHIPNSRYNVSKVRFSHSNIKDMDISVSTGPVVDFRIKDRLLKEPDEKAVPLIYPSHFSKYSLIWPLENFKKWNYISFDDATKSVLFPKGNYVLVKRFSSKEEKRRISASLFLANHFHSDRVGFENHLNIFHCNKKGLEIEICYGLMVYLNSTFIDDYFRQFSGHTQVNASDLKKLPYPEFKILKEIGQWAMINSNSINQDLIDKFLYKLINV